MLFDKKRRLFMANGIEDLKEKEKNSLKADFSKSKYSSWKNFQGREDAEMLQEKSFGWSAKKESRGDYDAAYDDY